MKVRLGTIAATLLTVAVVTTEAKAQSVGDLCRDIEHEVESTAIADIAADSLPGGWCAPWIDHLIDLLVIPAAYGLRPRDLHPSTISARLDPQVTVATAWFYNDLLYFPDADNSRSTTYRHQRDCAGTNCRTVHAVTGRTTAQDMRRGRFSGRGIQWTVLGQKGDVTLVKRESRHTGTSGTDYDWTGYGGWATHNAFFSRWKEGVDGRYEGSGEVYSYSAGSASAGNPPYISARWDGFMAGIDVGSAATRGNPVLGNAAIVFDGRYGRDRVDIAFTDILDVKTLDTHADMRWYDLAVRNGAFRSGADSNSVQGRFYGRRHEEVGGIFERNRISGAFGARRN